MFIGTYSVTTTLLSAFRTCTESPRTRNHADCQRVGERENERERVGVWPAGVPGLHRVCSMGLYKVMGREVVMAPQGGIGERLPKANPL